ncbi:uncharacterized protein LOC111379343 [Olea europaea var. sylvestris]|uniref:uncharacterized protein LOC111379343 n=1 Tax=Olea europaea var. sylvestris TaxID=158386 RepID=UPI000C1CDC48|nr:uncharacterized protein LOC111379343 [Olea europaea var. sylvestris]
MAVTDKVKFELDKLIEAKDQAFNLYNSMEAEKAQFILRKKEYEEKLNRMGIELNSRHDVEERLMGEIKALRASEEEARARAEEERGKVREAIQKVQKANERARQATKRVEEFEAKVDRAVKAWQESSEFDVVAQDVYVVALEELVGHIRNERTDIDVAFLDEALEGQKEELRRLSEFARVRIRNKASVDKLVIVKDELKGIKAKAEAMRAQQVEDVAKLDSALAKIEALKRKEAEKAKVETPLAIDVAVKDYIANFHLTKEY